MNYEEQSSQSPRYPPPQTLTLFRSSWKLAPLSISVFTARYSSALQAHLLKHEAGSRPSAHIGEKTSEDAVNTRGHCLKLTDALLITLPVAQECDKELNVLPKLAPIA